MKLYHPVFESPISLTEGKVNVIIIENENLLYSMVKEFKDALSGMETKYLLSTDISELCLHNNVDLITDVLNFNPCDKKIISAISKDMEKIAMDDEHYMKTVEIVSMVQKYIGDLLDDFNCPVDIMSEFDFFGIMKGANFSFSIQSDTLVERICDYVRLVSRYMNKSIFSFVNLKHFVTNEDLEKLYSFFEYEKYHLILFEGTQKQYIPGEQHLVIDKDLCVI